jgi:hypothetical protein
MEHGTSSSWKKLFSVRGVAGGLERMLEAGLGKSIVYTK